MLSQISSSIGRKMTEFQISRLPKGSLGNRLIEVLGGIDSYTKLPMYKWTSANGPHYNSGIYNHGYWDLRHVVWYQVKPEDLSHSVMQARDSRGKFVLLLRKEVSVKPNYLYNVSKEEQSFPTVEVITPSVILASHKGDLASFHNDDPSSKNLWIPHIHSLSHSENSSHFDEDFLSRISTLIQGKEMIRKEKDFMTGYPNVSVPFTEMTEKLK